MSTKIYEAYEFKGDLDELMSYLRQTKKRIWAKTIPIMVADLDDGVKLGWLSYFEALRKALRSSEHYIVEKGFGCIQNSSCSAVVYSHRGRLFVQFFGLPRDVKLTSKKLVDYHYQNQSDEWYAFDKRVKNKAWLKAQEKNYRERKRVWNTIFKRGWRPSAAGLTFEFISYDDANELSVAVFERIHNHKVMEGRKDDCLACMARKVEYEKEQAELKLEAHKQAVERKDAEAK